MIIFDDFDQPISDYHRFLIHHRNLRQLYEFKTESIVMHRSWTFYLGDKIYRFKYQIPKFHASCFLDQTYIVPKRDKYGLIVCDSSIQTQRDLFDYCEYEPEWITDGILTNKIRYHHFQIIAKRHGGIIRHDMNQLMVNFYLEMHQQFQIDCENHPDRRFEFDRSDSIETRNAIDKILKDIQEKLESIIAEKMLKQLLR